MSNAPPFNPSIVWAGGGYLSTTRDLVRFALAHGESQFLHPKTVRRMLTAQQTLSGQRIPNGIGWEVNFIPAA
jgi:serine beta-lactamase-like protein LACTB, mitochondrial